MMICRKCNETFTEDDRERGYTRGADDFTNDSCPYCGSESIMDAITCELCDEYSVDRLCEECKKDITKKLEELTTFVLPSVEAQEYLIEIFRNWEEK